VRTKKADAKKMLLLLFKMLSVLFDKKVLFEKESCLKKGLFEEGRGCITTNFNILFLLGFISLFYFCRE
jgi:hypothetical protein